MASFHYFEYLCLLLFVMASRVFATTGDSPSTMAERPSVGIAAYRRFHANDSLIGTPVPCTHQEKVCFRYNVLYVPSQNLCWNAQLRDFVANEQEFTHGSGHLFAALPEFRDPCRGYRMAFDGKCYSQEIVQNVLCGCDAEPTKHIVGGAECRCTEPIEVKVQQPEEDGKCLVPDLRFPDDRKRFGEYASPHADLEFARPLSLNCSEEQARCFAVDRLWVRGSCVAVWEKGPCPEEHVAVLDAAAALEGRAEGTCVHVRGGCAPGHHRMAHDGHCYADDDLEIIRTGRQYLTAFGNFVWGNTYVGDMNVSLSYDVTNIKDLTHRECIITPNRWQVRSPPNLANPPCGSDDKSKCSLYEVESGVPTPSLE